MRLPYTEGQRLPAGEWGRHRTFKQQLSMNINSKKLLIYHHGSFKAILKSSLVFDFFWHSTLHIHESINMYYSSASPDIQFWKENWTTFLITCRSNKTKQWTHINAHTAMHILPCPRERYELKYKLLLEIIDAPDFFYKSTNS